MTELVDPDGWEEYGGYGGCIVTISSGDITFTGSPSASNSETTTCGVGAEHPQVDLSCVDEITFDYDATYVYGSTTISFRIDNDIVWSISSTTTSGSATVDVSSYTGLHYLRFYRLSIADPYAYPPYAAGAYMDTHITNISAIATYSSPVLSGMFASPSSGVVPIDVTWNATAGGGCPPTGIDIDWEIRRDGTLIETTTTGSIASFTRTYTTEGTYVATVIANNSEESSSSETITCELIAIPPVSDFSVDRRIAQTGASVNFIDQSLYSPTSWEWKYQKDGVGGYVNFTNYTLQNPTQVFSSEGLYDIYLKVTSPYGNDTETKLGYLLIDDDVVVGSYPYKGSNEFAILLMRGSSYEHLIHAKGNTASILNMKVTRSDGGTSVAEFTLTATHRMSGETNLLQRDTQVYVLHYDWVSFSGVITEVDWNTKDVYGSSLSIPFRKVKVICEGATSLLKREFVHTDEVITNTPGEIYKQILLNSGCSDLQGTVQTDLSGTQKRQFGVMKGTTYDAVSNLSESTGYRMFDEHEGVYFRGTLYEYLAVENHAWIEIIDGVSGVSVGDYFVYLKRDPTAPGYDATDTRNTSARYRIVGRVTFVTPTMFVINIGFPLSTMFGSDLDYIKSCVVTIIKSSGVRIGFAIDRETNVEPLLDIGKAVLDSDLIDTDYINATVFTCTTVNQGKKLSVTIPACVKVDSAGTGNYFTFVSPYPCGSYVIDHIGNSIHIQGHGLFDPSDVPDIIYFVYKDPSGSGDLDYVRVNRDVSTTDVKEYYDNGIPITVITHSDFGALSTVPRGAFIIFKYDIDGDQDAPWDRRLYVSTTTGFYINDKIIVGGGFPSYSDRTFKVISVGTGYLYVYSYADYSVSFEDRPFFTGAIVFKETADGTTYTKDNPEIDSPIDQRGVITRTITCAQGSTIPELEVIASSYAVSEGVFTDIGEGKVPSRYAYSSIYPVPSEIDYTINKPIIEGTQVTVRFNDERRSYRVVKATYDYMKYMATFEFGGKKRDIPDSVKSVMNITNTTG